MKKILIAIIILLVSIYWFRPASAQSRPDLGIDSAQTLYKKYLATQRRGTSSANDSQEKYSTPPIFDEHRKRAVNTKSEVGNKHISNRDSLATLAPEDSVELSLNAPPEPDTILRTFGSELFTHESELTEPSDMANADDYILGPGDNLLIYLWGRVEKEFNLTVDREGKIFIPKIGDVVVWGKRLSEFKKQLTAQLRASYSEFEVTVSLGKIRSIRVYLIGEVHRPGAYTVSSLTTLFNALYLAGGPNPKGSYRAISLLRAGKETATVDLYDFLIRGDNSGDLSLKSGDAIFIPIVGPQVAVAGEVKRPAIYELKGNESAATMVSLAGGKTAMGYLSKISLERMADGDELRLMDINLDSSALKNDCNFAVKDGDRMTVRSMYDVKRNFVVVAGMVKHPGVFERAPQMTLLDVLANAQVQTDNVYTGRMNVFRTFSDNRREVINVSLMDLLSPDSVVRQGADIPLADRDSVHIYSVADVTHPQFVYIDGEIKRPGQYTLYQNMTIYDLIFLAGDTKRGAYEARAEIARTNSLGEIAISYVKLGERSDSAAILQEDDRVYIRQIPEWSVDRRVTLEGEVLFPGEYTLSSRDETLFQLIKRAGGLTRLAFPEGLILERTSINESLVRRKLDRIIRSTTTLERDSLGRIRQEDQVNVDNEGLSRIVIDTRRLFASEGKEANIVLEPGDKIHIPQEPSGVSVLGAVGATGTIKFEQEKNVDYYLKRAGGATKQADTDGIRLVKADGRVFSGSGVRGQRVNLGDFVIVPSEIRKDRDTMRDISSAMSIVTGLATSVFIITKL